MSTNLVKLGDIAETSSGGTPTRGNKNYYGGNIPWIKSGELPDGDILSCEEKITEEGLTYSSAKVLPEGTLLMAMYGATVGKLGVLTFSAATNQAVCAISPNYQLDKSYLFYWLLHIRDDLIKTSFGGAQPNISQAVVQDIEIPLRPIGEQSNIAAKLKSQLAEVEAARQALQCQLQEIVNLANAYIRESISSAEVMEWSLGEVLDEVKKGIGEN
jgi:type I restriction enzyme S subunit